MLFACTFSVLTVDATRSGAEMKLYEMEVELKIVDTRVIPAISTGNWGAAMPIPRLPACVNVALWMPAVLKVSVL